jgi:hypothetical protein
LIGNEHASEDLYESRLAGTIFANERMDFAATQIKIHAVQSHNSRKAFRNPMELKSRCHCSGRHGGVARTGV